MKKSILLLATFAAILPAAITTLDGVIAGMKPPEEFIKVGSVMKQAGVHHSFFYTNGRPGAAAVPTPGLGGAALTSYAGQIPFNNPGSGNTYLARFQITASTAGTALLADRLWHDSGIVVTTTTAQTINSVTWPARDSSGTTNGDGILVGLEVTTATSNASPVTNCTLSYTNQSGTAGQTATMASFPATAVAGTFVLFQLAPGDTGIRSIQSITLGTSLGSGTVHLVAIRVLSRVDITSGFTGASVDALTSGFPRMYDNSVPFLLWLPSTASATTISGHIVYTQG